MDSISHAFDVGDIIISATRYNTFTLLILDIIDYNYKYLWLEVGGIDVAPIVNLDYCYKKVC